MEMQVGKMILNAILYAILYIGIPLGILLGLDYFGIFTVSQSFITGIIIFGVVGVFLAVLKAAYPKDSAKNRVIMFLITVFSGVYLFYIFGGFNPNADLGNFSIETQQLSVSLGLQFIAWLLLLSSGVRSLQYLFEAFELRGVTKDSAEYKRRARPSLLFKIVGVILSLILVGWILSIIGSGVMIRPNLVSYDYDYNPPDELNFTLTYDLSNGGIYPLTNLNLKSEIWVTSSDNESALPPDTKIGESAITHYASIGAFDGVFNQNLTAIMDNSYIEGLVTTNASLSYNLIFDTEFGGISINATLRIPIPWNSPI
ncbi:MAG: hypothetical protein EU539_14135 [Promethearchaeota archaeon]|nr:MAG: hypothetical protein EU539_14135 [Candidatus Lokiarchaeota archaeon]